MGHGLIVQERLKDGDVYSSEQLRAANIHPETRLATDYLNHFNEVVMLFDLLPEMPEIAADIANWMPKSYVEHFRASNFKARELAIAAYETVAPDRRVLFERTIAALDVALCEAQDKTRALELSQRTEIRWLLDHRIKPLLTQAMALINGTAVSDLAERNAPQVDDSSAAQNEIDALFL